MLVSFSSALETGFPGQAQAEWPALSCVSGAASVLWLLAGASGWVQPQLPQHGPAILVLSPEETFALLWELEPWALRHLPMVHRLEPSWKGDVGITVGGALCSPLRQWWGGAQC